jgi:hypothetical protein
MVPIMGTEYRIVRQVLKAGAIIMANKQTTRSDNFVNVNREMLFKREMDMDRNNLNNFSYWYPHIKECGMDVPKSLVYAMPDNLYGSIFMEHHNDDMEALIRWIKSDVVPTLKEENKMGVISCKGHITTVFGHTTDMTNTAEGQGVSACA